MPLVGIYSDKDTVYDCTKEIYGRKKWNFCWSKLMWAPNSHIKSPRKKCPIFMTPGKALRSSPRGLCACVYPDHPPQSRWGQIGHIHHDGTELVCHPQHGCSKGTAFSCCSLGRKTLAQYILPQDKAKAIRSRSNLLWLV